MVCAQILPLSLMQLKSFRINAFASLLIILTLSGYLMVIGRGILIPIVTSIFFSMIIYPACRFAEHWVKNRALAILLTLLLALFVIGGGIWLISRQFYPMFANMDQIKNLIPGMLEQVIAWVASTFNLEVSTAQQWMARVGTRILNYLLGSIPNPSIFLSTLGLLPIYSFLFLLYRTSLKQFLMIQVGESKRAHLSKIIQEIQRLAQRYIYGLGIVIVILALLNSLGLWVIGLPYPAFWGGIAAILAVIPYIGTFIGGLLPFLYALVYTNTLWQPIAVVIFYLAIQQLEGNLITPKVVGSSVKINPLVAIIALFFFGAIWGLAGLILALPTVGIFRLVLSHIESLRPIARLMGNQIYQEDTSFLEEFNHERYRFLKFFFRN